MFDIVCPTLGRVLIWPSQLLGMSSVDGVIEVAFTCACDEHAVWSTGANGGGALVAHGAGAECHSGA